MMPVKRLFSKQYQKNFRINVIIPKRSYSFYHYQMQKGGIPICTSKCTLCLKQENSVKMSLEMVKNIFFNKELTY